jgi:hypothetical protein
MPAANKIQKESKRRREFRLSREVSIRLDIHCSLTEQDACEIVERLLSETLPPLPGQLVPLAS